MKWCRCATVLLCARMFYSILFLLYSIVFYSRSTNRRDTVNTVLPVLAYLLSDVIVFVDTVEPRRLQVR